MNFKFINKSNGIYIFALLVLVQFLIYNYAHIINLPPTSIHSWRQSDCLSFALNFSNGRGSFLQPCVNNLGLSGDGKAASDFPIIQYLIGNIWKVTGVNTSIFKITNVLFLFFGLIFVFKLFMWATAKNVGVSMLGALLINTSPNLAYYGVTTISDIHALSLSFIGIYFFALWMDKKKLNHLIYFSLIYALAGLLKASAGFSFLVCILIYFSWQLIVSIKTKTLPLKQLAIYSVIMLSPLIAWYFWFSYASAYNFKHPSGFFLVGVLPIWEIHSDVEIIKIFRALVHENIFQVFHPFILFSLVLSIITISIYFIKKHPFYVGIILLGAVIFALYILLFYQVLEVHDYYLINMSSVILIIITAIILIVQKENEKLLSKKIIKLFLLIMLLIFTYTTSVKQWARIGYDDKSFNNMLLFDNEKTKLMQYFDWNNNYLYKTIEDKNFKLENYGIKITDTIICLGDYTINRSLYALNRLGYTSFNTGLESFKSFIEEPKYKHLKYLILIEPTYKKNDLLAPYLKNLIFEKEATSIYRLR